MASTAKFHTAGRRLFNQIFNKAVSPLTTIYLGLRTLDGVGSHPADAANGDTLGNATTLAEVSSTSTGYARQAITVNSTNLAETLSDPDSLLTFIQKTFNFTGAGLPVNGITHAFIASTSDNTGVLIASAPLSAVVNAAEGYSLAETFTFKMSA